MRLGSICLLLVLVLIPARAMAAERWVDVVDLKQQLAPFLTKEGLLDPEFRDAVAMPSAYYTDFFGIQALADRSASQIENDFVRLGATVTARDEHSITLTFKGGLAVRFVPNSALSVMGIVTPFDHAYVEGTTWREVLKNLNLFREIVRANGMEASYFITNPTYAAERETADWIAGRPRPAEVVTDPHTKSFATTANAVLLAPEGVHGNRDAFDRLVAALADRKFDWLGMEMIPADMQATLDDFTGKLEASTAYREARARLLDYFKDAWNGRAGPKTSAEENYYFQLVEFARKRGARVIGMENVPSAFFFFRYGETPFGAAVRNVRWAETLPIAGRGVVFGGSAHFTEPGGANVQDFILKRRPNARLVSLVPIVLRKL
jgi:hypothetical protein